MRWNFRDFVRNFFVKFNFGTLTTFYYYRTCYITWNDAVRIVWTLWTPKGMSKYCVSEMKYEWVICNIANKHEEFKFISDWKICHCSPSVFLNRFNATWKLVTLLLMWHFILHALSIRDVRDIYNFPSFFFRFVPMIKMHFFSNFFQTFVILKESTLIPVHVNVP